MGLSGQVASVMSLSAALLALVQAPIYAEEPVETAGHPVEMVETLGDVTVTSTRVEKPLVKVPAGISLVGEDDIQLGQQQLGLQESLIKVPGIFLQDPYNFAQDVRIAIRGFGARSSFGIRGIKIFVDGIPATLPDGQGGVDDIDLGSAQRIEVIRSPISSLYGSASGGVISVYSEDGPPVPFVQGRFAYGSYDYLNTQLKGGGQYEHMNYLLNGNYTSLTGYRDHSAFEGFIFNSKFRYDIDPSSNFTAVINAVDQPEAQDPGGLTAAEVREDRRQARDRNLLFNTGEELDQQRTGFIYRKRFGTKHEILLRNYYVWRDFSNRLPFADGGQVQLGRFFLGGGAQYNYADTFFDHPNLLILGFDIDSQNDERQRFVNQPGGIRGPLTFNQDEDVTGIGAFLQNEFGIRDDLELTLGIRYDEVSYDISDKFLADGNDSGEITFDEPSPRVGLLWSPWPFANLYANFSTSFDPPTTTELANPTGGGGFNQDLAPQTATNYEIGAKGTLPGRARVSYDLALFHIDVEDELVPFELPAFPDREFFRNAGESTRNGAEVALITNPLPGFTGTLTYTYSDFTFDKFRVVDSMGNVDVFDGNQTPGIPKHFGNLELAYTHGSGFYGIWNLLAIGRLFANNSNSVEVPSYVVANLRGGWLGYLGPWEIGPFVAVNNMFDKEYNQNIRINAFGGRFFEPAPEINFYGGLTARLDF